MEKKTPSLDSLPIELIEHILYFDAISYVDICRLSCVSQLFNGITRSNKLWNIKYVQTWGNVLVRNEEPPLDLSMKRHNYYSGFLNEGNEKGWPSMVKFFDPLKTNWREEFQLRIKYKKAIHTKLNSMTMEFYHLDNVSNDSFYDFKDLCDNHPLTDHILIEELGRIMHDSDRDVNLTQKYYAEKALRYTRHTMLDTCWRTFLDVDPRPSLLKGACLIQQWCQPSKLDCTSEVSYKINEIIGKVFNEVQEVSPSHPVLKRGYPRIHHESGEILDKSLWTPYHCKVILNCINSVLFGKIGWYSVEYLYSADNIYIDKVIDKNIGIPVTQGVVYETIAGQLGVHLLPVNLPGHFLLKWLEYPDLTGNDAWTFIDVYGGGAFKKEHELDDLAPLVDRSPSWLDPVPPVKVFARICWNLVEVGRQHDGSGEGLACLCNSLELLSILSPDDMEHKLLLARVYMHLCINITRVINLLQEVSENDPTSTGVVGYMYRSAITTLETQKIKKQTRKLKCQHRTNETRNVMYAVGMLMVHKKYNYRCVIYGWDPVCTASKDWIKQMGVHKLMYKDRQPFYHVLVADGTNRYAAQENLDIEWQSEPIAHMEVGRYFEAFQGNHYLPNEQKRLEYPDDISARDMLYSAFPCMF